MGLRSWFRGRKSMPEPKSVAVQEFDALCSEMSWQDAAAEIQARWFDGAEFMRYPGPIPFHPQVPQIISSGLGPNAGDPAQLLASVSGWEAMTHRAISERLSQVGFQIQRRVMMDGAEKWEEIPDHDAERVFRSNPDHSAAQIVKLWARYWLATGEAYGLLVTDGSMPRMVQVMPSPRTGPLMEGGIITSYWVLDGQGRRLPDIPAEDVVRVWDPDPEDIYRAKGAMQEQLGAINTTAYATEHIMRHFENDAIPPAVLEYKPPSGEGFTPATLQEQRERFEEMWVDRYHARRGTRRGVAPMLPGHFEMKELRAQYGEQIVPVLEFMRDQVLMAYKTPKSQLGMVEDANRSNVETTQYLFDQQAVKPVADAITDALNHQYIPRFWPDQPIRFAFDEFVSRDKDFDLKAQAHRLASKLTSINEERVDEGRDEASWGELPVGAFTEQPYDGVAREPVQQFPTGGGGGLPRNRAEVLAAFTREAIWDRQDATDTKYIPAMTRGVRRYFKAQADAVKASLRSGVRAENDIPDLTDAEWAELWEQEVEVHRRFAYGDTGRTTYALLDAPGSFTLQPEAVRNLTQQGVEVFRSVNRTTAQEIQRELAKAVAEGATLDTMAKRVEAQVQATNRVFKSRANQAQTIARTEVGLAYSQANEDAFEQSGVVIGKRWLTARDPDVRDAHTIEGQTVRIDDSFTLRDGERASAPRIGPGGGRLSAGNSINCRCDMVPILEGEDMAITSPFAVIGAEGTG